MVFSVVFYAWGEPRFLPVLVVYTLLNYAVGRLIAGKAAGRRGWMIAGVCGNLGLLVYFKYAGFLTTQLNALSIWAGLRPLGVVHVALPLGISFIAFQGISYVVDVYRRDVVAQRSLLSFSTYKSMFPQLIAGPIVRYSDIAADIDRRTVIMDDLVCGARQFIVGLGQKVLVANVLAAPADQIFALPVTDLGMATAWLAIACYTLQIFFDFAGYSNMAIGLGRIIGFRYPVNFIRPYAAQSVTEFWRRWHMTLSRWFRDYLYIPLGGNRVPPWRTYANLMTVFLLCGFWHGANWTFLLWGGYHGIFLVIERLGLGSALQRLWRPLRHVYLVLVVMVGWVFFRSDTLNAAPRFLAAMVSFHGAPILTPAGRYLTTEVVVALCAGAVLAVVPGWQVAAESRCGNAVGLAMAHVALLAVLGLCLMEVSGGAYNPFIYYRF